MHRIEQLFDRLDRWRHLPAYQLERRADIFFSLYLAEVIEHVRGVRIDPRLIPELPMHKRLFDDGYPHAQSARLDYCCLAADRSKAFFVELKTDTNSRNVRQDERMRRAAARGFEAVVQGIIDITRAPSAPTRKYLHLLHLLAEHGCVQLPDELLGFVARDRLQGVSRLLKHVEPTVASGGLEIEVIYVQPVRGDDEDDVIDFAVFADVVARHEDAVSQTFAKHLRGWTGAAGAARPL